MVAATTMISISHSDALSFLRELPSATFDAVITDPPYPCVNRDYGRLSVGMWETLMHSCVKEFRRILKPSGSAAIILQPNQRRIGCTRPWLWDFMSWCSHEWNMVQDMYWWNYCAVPCEPAIQGGMLKPSVKPIVWLGDRKCFRDQNKVLWRISNWMKAQMHGRRAGDRRYRKTGSGHATNDSSYCAAVSRRGGTLPFNLLPFSGTNERERHGAVTPLTLTSWLVRFLCPVGGIVVDPFMGSGTTAIACLKEGMSCVGCDKSETYISYARKRCASKKS